MHLIQLLLHPELFLSGLSTCLISKRVICLHLCILFTDGTAQPLSGGTGNALMTGSALPISVRRFGALKQAQHLSLLVRAISASKVCWETNDGMQ